MILSIKNIMFQFITALCVWAFVSAPATASADPAKEFIMSATYGVLAGTLVGAATLAFTPAPGDNLRNIAKGASLGLYAGLLLGAYVAYWLPNQDEEDSPSPEAFLQLKHPPVATVVPVTSEKGFDGAALMVRAFTF